MQPTAQGRFGTTQWSLVLAAADRRTAEGEEALARLCASYWYPVFAYVRRRGHSVEDAQDLTQGFFTRMVEKGDLAAADRSRGRFRSFLLTACQHYLANENDRTLTHKRGGRHAFVSIDAAAAEGRYERALSHDETPEMLYDRQWCLTLLEAVLDDLRQDAEAAGRERVFDRLKPFLTDAVDAGTHAEAGAALGMTAGAVKVAVHRLRNRYRDALRQRVAHTVESEDDVAEELRDLLRTLSRPRETV